MTFQRCEVGQDYTQHVILISFMLLVFYPSLSSISAPQRRPCSCLFSFSPCNHLSPVLELPYSMVPFPFLGFVDAPSDTHIYSHIMIRSWDSLRTEIIHHISFSVAISLSVYNFLISSILPTNSMIFSLYS